MNKNIEQRASNFKYVSYCSQDNIICSAYDLAILNIVKIIPNKSQIYNTQL